MTRYKRKGLTPKAFLDGARQKLDLGADGARLAFLSFANFRQKNVLNGTDDPKDQLNRSKQPRLIRELGTAIGQVCSLAAMSWIVRPVVGTPADTPTTLRLKAAEFLRLARQSKNEFVVQELERLAATYLEAAKKMDGTTSRATEKHEVRTS